MISARISALQQVPEAMELFTALFNLSLRLATFVLMSISLFIPTAANHRFALNSQYPFFIYHWNVLLEGQIDIDLTASLRTILLLSDSAFLVGAICLRERRKYFHTLLNPFFRWQSLSENFNQWKNNTGKKHSENIQWGNKCLLHWKD